jgi:predicted nuclease with TOPRIM domain
MKMSNLYQLTNNYETVLNMLYDEDADEEMILDTLEAIEGEIEDKADNYAKIIKELEAKQNARKEEAKRLTESAKVFENRVKALKSNLFNSMKATGKTKFATDLFSFNIAKNGGKQTLTIDGEVPEEYIKTITENDTDKIRQALEKGEKLTFAHFEPRGESLRIK